MVEEDIGDTDSKQSVDKAICLFSAETLSNASEKEDLSVLLKSSIDSFYFIFPSVCFFPFSKLVY